MAKDKKTVLEQTGDSKIKVDPFEPLASQCQAEYNLAWKHQKSKKDEAEVRLKLYNNQKRDKEAVGDTTLFSIHQTLLASLYSDRLATIWEGREEGDEEVADNLDALAKYDYEDMQKDKLDYDWDWDTLFFGRGLMGLDEFLRDPAKGIFLPLPQVLDPITFLRDPLAISINGDRKSRGACRFYGYEVKMTKKDLEEHPHIFSDVDFDEIKFGSGTYSLLGDAISARDTAQGRENQTRFSKEESLGANAQYDITQWQTHYLTKNGVKKVRVWLANDRAKVIGIQVLDKDYWSVIDRPLYPTAHDWDGTSVPDLVEDKQRARAVAQNLGLKLMKADMYPMYIFNTNKVENKNDLKFNFNKFVPINLEAGESLANVVQPLLKSRPNLQLLDFIYKTLDMSAQLATATPQMQQGMVSSEKRTATEVTEVAGKVDTRYSLSAKVFGWSEKDFWNQWYWKYKDNFQDTIDEKVVRLTGAFGATWRKLGRSNIIARLDPDVRIESQILSRAKQFEERSNLSQFFTMAFSEPTANRRYGLKKLARLNGMEKDEIDRLFPPTIDERIADDENDELSQDHFVGVQAEDDHNVHLEMHVKAADTPATTAHIKTHEKALSIKKTKPELFPQEPQAATFQPAGTEKLAQPGTTPPVAPKIGGTAGAIQPMKPMMAA